MRFRLLFILVAFSTNCFSQYQFKGQVDEDENVEGQTVYLSVIEDYRKLSRISFDQIIKKTTIDSLGLFKFDGNNLPQDNRIYRIHVDECMDISQNSNHFFGKCENSKSILFIADNRDTISFPTSFADQVLCEITSTNPKSSAFLEIDVLKEEMAFDFNDFRSEANKKLNSKKWFFALQEFGKNLEEPLAELYIFDFLSDKRNETYAYYLKDVGSSEYYSNLSQRLEKSYPNETFTQLYQKEITLDKILTTQSSPASSNRKWLLGSLLAISMLLNLYFLWQKKALRKKQKTSSLEKLTAQEQKIVDEILRSKTNKEIASDLFISLSTVKTHINNLYKKLNVTSREEIKQLF